MEIYEASSCAGLRAEIDSCSGFNVPLVIHTWPPNGYTCEYCLLSSSISLARTLTVDWQGLEANLLVYLLEPVLKTRSF